MGSIAPALAQQPSSNGVGTAFELSFWQSVDDSGDRAQLEAYLAQYPNGTFSGLAKAKIASLTPAKAAPVSAPAAAAPPAPVAAVAVAPPPATMPAVLMTSPAAPAPALAPAPAAAVAAPSLLEQMAAIGKEDGPTQHEMFAESGPVPPRPAMTDIAMPAIPDHFCSAEERNRFHDLQYKPAVARADQNNDATIAHLRNVQALHKQAMAASQVVGANALAREATAYKPFADQAYQARIAMTDLFNQIMATPLSGC